MIPTDGLIAVVKRDCPTCELTEPVLAELAARAGLTVLTQDDPAFPASVPARVDDTALDLSHRLRIEIVPTLIRLQAGAETARTHGWDRAEWEKLTGLAGLGPGLPALRPGCGARNVEPGIIEKLKVRHGETGLAARAIPIGEAEDEVEAMFDRGWSDGLPLVPPTPERVLRMLSGTARDPKEVVGIVPPDLAPATVEKIAINAVMAGCRAEYLPTVLAAVEAVLDHDFCMHGVLATTMYVGPVLVVNGPVRQRIGMNALGNALGQGNRANATIGRAVQLVVRNIGGGRPREVDRATLGNPGKYTFCFAEDEEGSSWQPLAQQRGVAPGRSAVTAFAGYGLHSVVDQKSREPMSLARSFAAAMRAVHNIKLAPACDMLLVVCPEHERTFRAAGWSKQRLHDELMTLLEIPAADLMAGAHGIAEGRATPPATPTVNKIRPGGLLIARAGGGAGMFSAIIGGWSGDGASRPVTKEVKE